MKAIKAFSLEEAQELLSSRVVKNVEMCFELTTDEFFRFTDEWCGKGAKIAKKDNFIISLKSVPSPPSE